MKLRLKGPEEVEKLRRGGRQLARILAELARAVRPGVKTIDLDRLAQAKIGGLVGGRPAFLNYRPVGAPRPFPAALCISIDEEVVHGLPSERILKAGEIVTLDLGLEYEGMFTDSAISLMVGETSPALKRLLTVTREALARGVNAAKPGGTTGDIGAAISAYVDSQAERYGLVQEFGGHGVGFKVHEEPEVSNLGSVGEGVRLETGLVVAIEPMVTLGRPEITIADDGYTVKTQDRLPAAHFEQTVLVTDSGPEILTPFEL